MGPARSKPGTVKPIPFAVPISFWRSRPMPEAPSAVTTGRTDGSATYPEAWRPSSLQDVLSRTPEPPPWVIEELLPADSGLLCSGQPHAMKSLNWLAAAIESVVRHTVWGKFASPKVNRVLFIETEDPRWLVEKRIHGFAKGLGLKRGDDLEKYGFFFACTGPFTLVECETELLALIDDVKPDWVVLSTMQGLLGGADWSQQKDMGPVDAIMVKLQRRVPLVAITHSPRDTKVRRSAGTITQDANYLTVMHFQKNPTTGVAVDGVDRLADVRRVVEKRRDARPVPSPTWLTLG